MISTLRKSVLVACVAVLAIGGIAMAAAIILKTYTFSSRGSISQMRHTNGKNCTKSHAGGRAFGITVGRDTAECTYRTTVSGPTLDITATGRLLSATPPDARNSIFLSVSLRHGDASEYELAVFPRREEFRLYRRHTGGRDLVASGERPALINGVGDKNRLRLRAYAAGGGDPAELKAFINGTRVGRNATSSGPNFNGMGGQNSTVSIARAFGSNESIRGAKATFDSIVLKTRNPIG